MTPLLLSSRLHGVRARFIFGSSIKHTMVSSAIYGEYLPAAHAEHRYRIAPAPTIAGCGLAEVQEALDLQRRGVSATKLVVKID
ncbi:hypothetical protein [Amnibacterium kyonggiense]|nr:hypothetical protein [Amnibacterium kyonggiense]